MTGPFKPLCEALCNYREAMMRSGAVNTGEQPVLTMHFRSDIQRYRFKQALMADPDLPQLFTSMNRLPDNEIRLEGVRVLLYSPSDS